MLRPVTTGGTPIDARVRSVSRPAVLVLAALCAAAPVAAAIAEGSRVTSFDLQGHRGARGLRPENTLAGFAFALELGVSTLELDCAVTRDGIVVVSHDPVLNPDYTRDEQGRFLDAAGPPIATLSYAELQRYDVGRLRPGTSIRGALSGSAGGRR